MKPKAGGSFADAFHEGCVGVKVEDGDALGIIEGRHMVRLTGEDFFHIVQTNAPTENFHEPGLAARDVEEPGFVPVAEIAGCNGSPEEVTGC